MKFSICIIAALTSVISSVAEYTTPVGDPSGNPIYTPSLGEIVPVGTPYNITWKPTTTGTITLLLLRGPSTNCVPIATLTTGLQNKGWYEWAPSTDLEADTSRYGIELIVDETGQYQYSVQFGVGNDGEGESSSSSVVVSSRAMKASSSSSLSTVAATLDVAASTTSPTSATHHSHSKSTLITLSTTLSKISASSISSATAAVSFDYPTPQVAYLNTTVSEYNLTATNITGSTSGAYQSIDARKVGVTVIVLFAMVL
ncbi:hypothetical protein SAICODRAFT_33675 [Saitoella complicata NRRL Y-17804]|uniref:Yeast cell wall synthesis Kre9/Knh1-like N-terminal domain-containing protein n=1 Tax=Saitoella complicata (strain BCRC 22490 / CBS 7301 / JCM 7358 / NBRC 10748 / NRRL Y-17804) TaxID=698492 RepID=A0A0E9NQD7_SAICN|nr:uncharacterized protein SAICODRAFT_33675 [Saitoella complicata NRRL Y-17804]ODQ55039.1 hypothetical protein SAICODRAFT_33675 [Saitoella complicata NRRL Y-17804]GAO52059.1 hypothetical protein G7K_6146-t1 [Saitoella complicata NRRL Y-17804]